MGVGECKVNYCLCDWGVFCQCYWGVLILMVMLEDGIVMLILDDQLLVILLEDVVMDGIISLIKVDLEWVKIIVNGMLVLCEIDIFDIFMEFFWYYVCYICLQYKEGMLDFEVVNYWLLVDIYIGGIEYVIMYLFYFCFFYKLMCDVGMVNFDELVKQLLCQGMVLVDVFYYVGENGECNWVFLVDVIVECDEKGCIVKVKDVVGYELVYIGMSKMFKLKNNGIDLQVMVECYGVDIVCLFMMFVFLVDMIFEWQEFGVEGVNCFLKCVWKLVYEYIVKGDVVVLNVDVLIENQKVLCCDVYKMIVKVIDDIGCCQIFNIVIVVIMELMNKLVKVLIDGEQDCVLMQEVLLVVVCMFNLFILYICFMLWQELKGEGDIDNVLWLVVDEKVMVEDFMLVVVQVNGKVCVKIIVLVDVMEEQVCECVGQEYLVVKYFDGVIVRKVIYVSGKFFNLVVG